MFLFIFESIGTSELILVGIVALIFLGPRKLPELAKKAGKIMAEFRGTAAEFKQTWEKEVDFEEEKKAFSVGLLDEEVARDEPAATPESTTIPDAPAIRAADPEAFKQMIEAGVPNEPADPSTEQSPASDKKNWL
ncbi:MAG: Sec-independent protein translocase protein TatB [Pyrinomonadaceae bacterium]